MIPRQGRRDLRRPQGQQGPRRSQTPISRWKSSGKTVNAKPSRRRSHGQGRRETCHIDESSRCGGCGKQSLPSRGADVMAPRSSPRGLGRCAFPWRKATLPYRKLIERHMTIRPNRRCGRQPAYIEGLTVDGRRETSDRRRRWSSETTCSRNRQTRHRLRQRTGSRRRVHRATSRRRRGVARGAASSTGRAE